MADQKSTTSFKVSQQAQTINLTVSNKIVPPDAKVDLTATNNSIKSIETAQKTLSENQKELNNRFNDLNKPQDNKQSDELIEVTKTLKSLTRSLNGLVKALDPKQNKTESSSSLITVETLANGLDGSFKKNGFSRGLAEALNQWTLKKENIDNLCRQLSEVAQSSSSTIADSEKATTEPIANNIVINNTPSEEAINSLKAIQDSLNTIQDKIGNNDSLTSNGITGDEIIKYVIDASDKVADAYANTLKEKISSLNTNTSNENINSLNEAIIDEFKNSINSKLEEIKNSIDAIAKTGTDVNVQINNGNREELKSLNAVISDVEEDAVKKVIELLPNEADFLKNIGEQIGEKINEKLVFDLSSLANASSSPTNENAQENGAANGEDIQSTENQESTDTSTETAENGKDTLTPTLSSNEEQNGEDIQSTENQESTDTSTETAENGKDTLTPTYTNKEQNGEEIAKKFMSSFFDKFTDIIGAILPKTILSKIETVFSPNQTNNADNKEKLPQNGLVVQPPQNGIAGKLNEIIKKLDNIDIGITLSLDELDKFNTTLPSISIPAPNIESSETSDKINESIINTNPEVNVKVVSDEQKLNEQPTSSETASLKPEQSTAKDSTPTVEQPKPPKEPIEGEKNATITQQKLENKPPEPKKDGLYVELTGDNEKKFDSAHKILSELQTDLRLIRSNAIEERKANESAKRAQAQFGDVSSNANAPKAKRRSPLDMAKSFAASTKGFGSKLLDFFTSAKVKLFLMLAGLVAVIVAFIWTLVKFPGLREKLVNWMKGVGVKLWNIWTNFWTAAGPKARTIAIVLASLIGLMVFGPWGLLVGGIMLLAGLWPKYKGIIIATVAALTAAALLIYFGPIGLLIGVGAAVIGAIYAFRKQIWDGLKSAFSFIGDALKYWLAWPINLLSMFFPGLGKKLKDGLANFLSGIPFVGKHIKKLFGGEGEEGPDEKAAVKTALADGKNIEEEIRSSKGKKAENIQEPTAPGMPGMPTMPSMSAAPQPMTPTAVNPMTSYSSSMSMQSANTSSQTISTTSVGGRVNVSSAGVEKLVEAISKSTKPCADLLNQIYERMSSAVSNRSNVYSSFNEGVRRMSSTTISRVFGNNIAEALNNLLSPVLITLNDIKSFIGEGVSAVKEAFGIVDEIPTTSNSIVTTTTQTMVPSEGEPMQKYVVVDNALEPHTFESNAEYETYMQAIQNTTSENQTYANGYEFGAPERPEESQILAAEEINANQAMPEMNEKMIEEVELSSSATESSSLNMIKSSEQTMKTVNSEKLVAMQHNVESIKKEGTNAAAKQRAQEKTDDENKFDARMGRLPRIIAAGLATYFDNKELKINGGEMSPMPMNNDKATPLGIKVVKSV